jgi:TRAP transporter TAXI family solute receptor
MLKKMIVILGMMFFLGLTFVTYSSAADTYKWPDFLRVTTPNVGTANHSIASAWTAAFTASTGVRARVLPAPNGYARGEWLTNNQADLALIQASDYIERLDGFEGFASRSAGPADTRACYISLVTPWGLMVRGDSKIKTIYDIGPETRVAWYRGSSFIMTGIRALLATQGLTPDDVKLVEVGSYGANSKVIAEGRADVTYTSPISDLNYEVAANPKGIRWLNIPTAAEDAKALKAYKALQAGYAIAAAKVGVESARGVRMSQAYQNWHVRGDENEEFVYHLVKWFDENYNLYKDKYVHAVLMNMDNFIEFLDNDPVEPIHPGAIRYLKEKGLWKDKYTIQNEFNLELSKKYIDGFQAALKAADQKGIKVSPENKVWMEFWKQYKNDHGLGISYGVVERPM